MIVRVRYPVFLCAYHAATLNGATHLSHIMQLGELGGELVQLDTHGRSAQCDCLRKIGGGRHVPAFLAVISRWRENVSWVHKLPVPALVYEHGNLNAIHTTSINMGSEASAYLQYIVDHRDCLPRWSLFLHGHGRTGRPGTGWPNRHHWKDPAHWAACLDVVRIDLGFLALGHTPHRDYWHGMSEVAKAALNITRDADPTFRGIPPQDREYGISPFAYISQLEGKHMCSCATLEQAMGGEAPCRTAWGWPAGAEFWVREDRILRRSLSFWQQALNASLGGRTIPRHGMANSMSTTASYCFESIWHALMGEPLYNYTPPWAHMERVPRVSFEQRWAEASFGAARPRGESASRVSCERV